jgi:hypothetical protein
MATKKTAPKPVPEKAAAPDVQATPAPLNREQRRAQKFGRAGKVHQHDPATPWPENEANPALRTAASDLAGPGTGGATKNADRAPEHEGAHGGNSTKG